MDGNSFAGGAVRLAAFVALTRVFGGALAVLVPDGPII